jgi:hypothetical protein
MNLPISPGISYLFQGRDDLDKEEESRNGNHRDRDDNGYIFTATLVKELVPKAT